MSIKEVSTDIKYPEFGNMMVISEWISGKTDKKKYLKWFKSHRNYHTLRQTFDDNTISKYLDYLELSHNVENGPPKIWIVDKFLYVNPDGKFDLITKPFNKSNACYVKNKEKIIRSIEMYTSFGEYLELVMRNPENNNIWVSYMKTRLMYDGKLYSVHEKEINNFDLFHFIETYKNDPIVTKWSQYCALACVAKDLIH